MQLLILSITPSSLKGSGSGRVSLGWLPPYLSDTHFSVLLAHHRSKTAVLSCGGTVGSYINCFICFKGLFSHCYTDDTIQFVTFKPDETSGTSTILLHLLVNNDMLLGEEYRMHDMLPSDSLHEVLFIYTKSILKIRNAASQPLLTFLFNLIKEFIYVY